MKFLFPRPRAHFIRVDCCITMEGVSLDTAATRIKRRRLLDDRHELYSRNNGFESANAMQVFNSKRIKPQTDQIKTINTPLPPAIFPSYENSSLRINSHPTSGSRLALSESLQTTQLSDTGISEDAKNCRVRPVAQRLYSSSTMGVQPTVVGDDLLIL